MKFRESEEKKKKDKTSRDLQRADQAMECIFKYYINENTNQWKTETFSNFETT